jgi:hypothetical protein
LRLSHRAAFVSEECGQTVVKVKSRVKKGRFIVTAEEFRTLALDIEGAVESAHMRHPDFRVGGKIFATLGHPDDEHGMVKLTVEQQRLFVKKAPKAFKPCNGAWGWKGCTNVVLRAAGESVVAAALDAAAENVASQVKEKKKKATKSRR